MNVCWWFEVLINLVVRSDNQFGVGNRAIEDQVLSNFVATTLGANGARHQPENAWSMTSA